MKQKSTDTDASTDTNKNTRYYRYSIPSTGIRPITSLKQYSVNAKSL